MPFTLVATIDAAAGHRFVKGQWRSIRGSALYIDSYASLAAIGEAARPSSGGSSTGGETSAGSGGSGGGERDGVLNLPPNTRFGVTSLTNSAAEQTIDIYIDDNPKPAATFKGAGTQDENLGTRILDSGKGRVRVIVTANGKPSRLGSRQVALYQKAYFGIVGSEDGTDDDYNDGLVVLNWPRG